MTTEILSKLAPKNSGAFPTHSDIHTEGGYQVRADATDRDSIPTANRKQGMWVKLISDGLVYQLGAGLTNGDWTIVALGGAVIFDGGTDPDNIRADRPTHQSPIDNTKIGIVNLSSDSTGTSPGATNNYVTIAGGNQNQSAFPGTSIGGGITNNVGADYGTISGGVGNSTTGTYAVIGGGSSHTVVGSQAVVSGGDNNHADGAQSCVTGGSGNTAGADTSSILGGAGNTIVAGATGSAILAGNQNNVLATAQMAVAMGYLSEPDKCGQVVHSCGNNGAAVGGGSQYTRVVYFTESINAATVDFNENIAVAGYTLQSNRNYALRIAVVAAQAGGVLAELHNFDILVSVDNAGAVTATPASPPTPTLSIGAGTYVVTYTTATNLFTLNFTGAAAVTVRATATIEATELLYV